MKKFIIFVLYVSTLLFLVGCSSNSDDSKVIVGDWYVVSTETTGDPNAQATADVYEKYRRCKITEDGKFILIDLDHAMSYELLEDSYIKFHNMGEVSKNKYELSKDSLQISFLDGSVIINFKKI